MKTTSKTTIRRLAIIASLLLLIAAMSVYFFAPESAAPSFAKTPAPVVDPAAPEQEPGVTKRRPRRHEPRLLDVQQRRRH